MEMCIDTKKRVAPATSSFWVAPDASGKTGRSRWASIARSVPSNPSASNLVRLAVLVALVNLVN